MNKMSIIPELTVGLQTAWWFSAIYIIGNLIIMFIFPKESWSRFFGGSDSEFTKNKNEVRRKIEDVVSHICWFGLIVYAIFVPIKFGTIYFYLGLAIFIIGMLLYEISLINYTSTPVGKPVTRGLYKISRNPIYVFDYVLWIGIGVLTASWIVLLVKTIGSIAQHYLIIEEEYFCLEKYGESYKNYMQKIPRYLGF